MTADQDTSWDALSEELEELEERATSAVVPGELRAWCDGLVRGARRVGSAWQRYAEEEGGLLEQILREDRELGHRVDHFIQAFAALSRELFELREWAAHLLEQDLEEPAGSEEPTEDVRELRRRALEWIVDTRAHHGDVSTFLLEAVYRDRGVAD